MQLTDSQERQLRQLVTTFLEENAKVNLSAFRTPESCWIGNVLDSISILEILPKIAQDTEKLKILDIGTGGGFPLLPLALCLPDSTMTGIDSVGKKIDAIKRIAEKMQMRNIELLTGRAEEFGRGDAHREKYDIVTARALAELPVLLEYAAPFVKVGGYIVAWKSLTIDQELQDSLLARAEFSCHLVDQHFYELPENFGKRQLLIFEKTSPLSQKYPRDVGVPKKNPLV